MELSLRRLIPAFAWPTWAWSSSENQTENETREEETSNKDDHDNVSSDKTMENTDEVMDVEDAIQVTTNNEKTESMIY